MGQPTVTISINTGTEGTPVWTAVTSTLGLWFAGAATTASSYDKLKVPIADADPAAELWVANHPLYASGTQITVYKLPTGAAQNQNLLRVYFASFATPSAPKLTAWDNSLHTTTNKAIFTGTSETSNTALIKATESTGGAPSQDWCTRTTESAGGSTTNALKGSEHYVECAAVASADSAKIFVIALWVPASGGAGRSKNEARLAIEYTWT